MIMNSDPKGTIIFISLHRGGLITLANSFENNTLFLRTNYNKRMQIWHLKFSGTFLAYKHMAMFRSLIRLSCGRI